MTAPEARLLTIAAYSLVLSACAGQRAFGPPNEYAVAPEGWVNNRVLSHPDYNPFARHEDYVRAGFVAVLKEVCTPAIKSLDDQGHGVPDPNPKALMCVNDGKSDPYTLSCWSRQHPYARQCVDAVITHAVDQCVAKMGAQNAWTAKANLAIGGFFAAGALASDGAVIANPGVSTAAATVIGNGVVSSAGTARNFAPATVSLKVSDMILAGQTYAQTAGFTDSELPSLRSTNPQPGPTTGTHKHSPPPGYTADESRIFLRYSRLHDAVFANCPVGSY